MHAFPENTDLCDVSVVPLVGSSPLLTQENQLNESIRLFKRSFCPFPWVPFNKITVIPRGI